MEKEEVEIKEEQKQDKNTKKKKAKKEPNPFFQLLKEAWSHKRYRATIILVFWFIFLFLVAGSLRQAPESVPLTEANQTKPVSALEQFRDMTNYEFQTKLTWTEIESSTVQERVLSGRRLGYQEEFDNTTDHTSYYVDNGIIYKRNETSLEATNDQFIELTLKPDMTYHILEKATLEATTDYKDGSTLKTYTVSLKDFVSIYHDSNSSSEGEIVITTKEANQQITEVSYDLLDFVNQNQATYSGYGLTITYQNIGKVEEIHIQ